ncbi:MAG TPA: helix-turn-helix transcriptional regulator [Arthrobacter sp.]|nr:helix-turn-helix transcriptional regulator [Arthrobacter sp.]
MAGTTVRSRRLAGILKEYRKASGLRQPEVAAYVGRTSVWVSRTETAATCRPSVGDVRALLVLYGVTSPAEIEQVVDLARQVRETGWWHDYGLSDTHRSFVALESEAAGKRVWSDMFIPGLLQTEGYARAVITAGPDTLDDARVDDLVRVRMERKKILHRPRPLQFHALTDEAALRRRVGTREVMAAQLDHLADAASQPNVTLQVVPFTAGAHPGMAGPFSILEYPDPADPDVVYAETPAGGIYMEDAPGIERTYRAFAYLAALALSPAASLDLADRYAAGL